MADRVACPTNSHQDGTEGASPDRAPVAIRDRGITLIEIVIVTAIVGLIVSSLSGAVLIVLKTSPTTELRIDDARSTRGLATWLSHDVASTPAYQPHDPVLGGFDTGNTNRCGAPGSPLVEMIWREFDDTYVASYRLVNHGNRNSVQRFTCHKPSGSATFTATASSNVAAGLALDNPAVVTFRRATAGDDTEGGPVSVVEFRLRGLSGERVVVDAASRNPAEFFSE